jgi:predicted amidohydrolase
MGYAELDLDGEHVYDSALIVDQHGHVSDSYRKIHLFQSENGTFQPGNTPCILDLGFGKMGVLICYDLEFPEAARELAVRGADWIAVSTGNMTPNQHLQEIYLQSRAAENRVWVCLANRVGIEPDLEFFGSSGAADPFGNLAAQAGGSETLLLVDIDLTRAKQAYLNADYLTDRRSDLYRNWTA